MSPRTKTVDGDSVHTSKQDEEGRDTLPGLSLKPRFSFISFLQVAVAAVAVVVVVAVVAAA